MADSITICGRLVEEIIELLSLLKENTSYIVRLIDDIDVRISNARNIIE